MIQPAGICEDDLLDLYAYYHGMCVSVGFNNARIMYLSNIFIQLVFSIRILCLGGNSYKEDNVGFSTM